VCAKPALVSRICPKCSGIADTVHDVRMQRYKHLPIWGMDTILTLPIFRLKCNCDPEHPFDMEYDFIRKYQRQTVPYEKYIFSLCRNNSIENVSLITDMSNGTCQRIFNHYAQLEISERDSVEPEFLGIDEFAVKKGHDYNTVIYDLVTHRLIDVIEGRTKEDVMSYFNVLSSEYKHAIKAVAMDMSRSYCNSVRESLPNAKPVIDRFHISQLFHRLVDEARKHIQNKVRKEEAEKPKVFGIRWALLKNFEDLTASEMDTLFSVCDEYPKLGECFGLKEEFRRFFEIDNKEEAAAFLDYFKELVVESEIPELLSFCKTLDNWREYILNYYSFKITNGPTEGLNNKIKNIKRRAYGYRNHDNFILRLKLECAA
jgi:transposase